MSKIRILLVDDHNLVRAGLRSLIEGIADFQVVGEAADGREAIEGIKTHQPHVVLMDISMAYLNGLDAAARISKELPEVRVIMLSMHANEEYVSQALRAGASGYLLKSVPLTELELAIRAAMRGEVFLSSAVSKDLVSRYLSRLDSGEPTSIKLTPRQREILQLIAEGKSTKEIAYLLNVSVKTVEAHRTQMMERLNIHDIAGLVRYAIKIGLVEVA